MPRRPRQGERGFTLTELLVALTVTVIGLAGLLSLHVTTVRGNATAASSAEAMNIAEQTLEDHRGIPVRQLENKYSGLLAIPAAPPSVSGTWNPIGTTEADITLTEVIGRNGRKFYRRLYAREVIGESQLIRIRVIVFWADGGAVPDDQHDETVKAVVDNHQVELVMVRSRVDVL